MARKRIGYGKVSRVIEMDEKKWGENGGDNEPATLLLTLADRNPDVDWVVVSKNSGWAPPRTNIINMWNEWGSQLKMTGLDTTERVKKYDDVTSDTFAAFDGIIMWIGQHGTSNSPIPMVKDRSTFTTSQVSFVLYASYLIRGINHWRNQDPFKREEIWLNADVRNVIKARDLKWPRFQPILAQFNVNRDEWNERYEDPITPEEFGAPVGTTAVEGKWRHTDRYVASGLELVGIPPHVNASVPWEDRDRFGVMINETRNYGMKPHLTRKHAMENYIIPAEPSWVHGTWTAQSKEEMGMNIHPIPYKEIWSKMESVKSTFTTPGSGGGWATAKPWESFVTDTICFFHPAYDTQGHILPTLAAAGDDEIGNLARWLRVTRPEDLRKRIDAVENDQATYEWLANAQCNLLVKAQEEQRCVHTIERRLGL